MNEKFKKDVMFIMIYFKRINKKLPKPVLANICNYLKCSKKTICTIDTTFPSALREIDTKYYSEGGMMLLKVNDTELNAHKLNSYPYCIKLKYKEPHNETKIAQNYMFIYKNEEKENQEYFSDNSIKKALALYYYSKYSRKIMKVFNKEQKNKETKLNREYLSSDDNTKIVNNVINYFTSHFYKEEGLDETKKDKYIKKLKKIL